MATVSDRIEQAPACQVINLTEEESTLYTGAGSRLARFVDGRLVELFDLANVELKEDVQAMADAAARGAMEWLATAQGEVWLVLCSCYQLCDPRRISLRDASSIAHMLRVVGEALADQDS